MDRIWYEPSIASLALLPLSWLFRTIVWTRRRLYRNGLLRSFRLDTPVVVVGNLTIGGTGKTPVTIALVDALLDRGMRPGVVSRGYRGTVGHSPLPVLPHSDPAVVGDEPVLIAERCRCPVAVHPDRVAAARLLEEQKVDVIVADDGLQHYRLERDLEIAVVDGTRGFGNGRLLPAGPLREPASRLRQVDQVLVNGAAGRPPPAIPAATCHFELVPGPLTCLASGERRDLESFAGQRVRAVAAIGNPERFFALLRAQGLDVSPHALPDHAELGAADLDFGDGLPVMITEKDAVKCRHLSVAGVWYLPVDAVFEDRGWIDTVVAMVRERTKPT